MCGVALSPTLTVTFNRCFISLQSGLMTNWPQGEGGNYAPVETDKGGGKLVGGFLRARGGADGARGGTRGDMY